MSMNTDTSSSDENLPHGFEGPDDLLQHQNTDLQLLVAELRKANREIDDSRRAALNMMEDAMLSEEAAKASSQRANEILESISDAFYAVDSDFRFTYVNRKAEEWWGRSRDQLIGRHYATEFPEAVGSESYRMHLQVMTERQPVRFKTVSPVLNRWIEVSIFPDKHGGLSCYFRDISVRENAEEALRLSESRARTLADAIPHILWANDAKGAAVYFNRRWFEYTGLSEEASVGPGWEAVVHPDDALQSKARWNRAQETGEVFDTEYRLRRHDGKYRWFIGRNVPMKDEEGRITGWFGSATDIQDMREAAEALQASEERLRVTLESATDYAVITNDTNGIIVGWSAGAERIFGYSDEEARGRHVRIIFTPEDQAAGAPEQEMETAIREGRAPDERWHMRKDGSRFFLSGVMRPIFNPRLSGFVKVARDLTEERQAEERLRIWEERYRTALQSAEMGAWDWYIRQDYIIWNDQQYLLLGLEPDHSRKNAGFFLQFVYKDDEPRVCKALWAAVEQGSVFDEEFRIVPARAMEPRWVYAFGRSVELEDSGRATRMIGVMYDISERKRIEQQKDEFIGIASHELKTPVTSIKAYAEVLEDMFGEAGDQQSAGLMQRMDKQIDRLTGLISTMLDVTRISQGQLEISPQAIDLGGLAVEVVEAMQHSAKQRLRLEAGEVKPVYADRERIRQVLTNLLANAIKYSPGAGEVLIRVMGNGADSVNVCVQDFGIGMSEEVRSRVFERFYRANDGIANTYPGLGLGLYISAQIIDRHGGEIRVESRPGEGSTFCFTLPVAP
jgi:PAS domain S-box-containing protein